MLVDRQTNDENGEVKVDAGETGQTERDTEKVQPLHAKSMRPLG